MADTNFANPAILTEQSSAATPPANTVALYPKTDGRFYGKDDAGTEFAIGTIGGTAGTIDNAVPRADGTGGGTLQGSDIIIDDATTSTQNNIAIRNDHTGQTNSSLVLTPKGTGSIIAGPKPDGTSTGGNARGSRCVDIQVARASATQVASGNNAVAIGGECTAGGNTSVAIGYQTSASGTEGTAVGAYSSATTSATAIGRQASASQANATCIGYVSSASGDGSFAGGFGNTASGNRSVSLGQQALSDRLGMFAHCGGRFAANGDAQCARFVLRCKTTTNAAVEMALDGGTTYLGIPSGKVIACTINISGVKSDGSAVAHYVRQYAVKNVGGTSSEVYAPITIGSDNASGTVIALSANNTDDTLRIAVTGISAETWRWVASVDAVEIAYGT